MNLPFFIARRYLVSKRKANFINIISILSIGGIAFSTAALIIVLSVFNGLEDLLRTLNNSFDPDIANLPVTGVTWLDADAYASWKGKRLPTEAEWEYAARNGDEGKLYPWGNTWMPGYANVGRGADVKKPVSVGSYQNDKTTRWEVFDLAGNVSEWVKDNFRSYDNKPSQNDQLKVYRGGHFTDPPETAMATYRWYDKADTPTQQTLQITGFRCAKDVGN